MITIAHLSDIHIDDERSVERTERVMAYLNDLPGPIDAVLVTGDIADHGAVAEYEVARRLFASPHPVFSCPGNHDVRSAYRQALLGEAAGDAPINRVHRTPDALFALCDSSIPGRNDGYLADETLEWLDGVLAETPADTPAFVCFHHPPLTLQIPFVDGIRQTGEQRLADVIARHPRVAGILCGHAHTPAASTFAGLPLLVAPGVVSTIRLPWERGELVDLDHPPMVAFHVLGADLRLTTHYRAIPQKGL